MKFLALDTSTKVTAVALGDESRLIVGARRKFSNGRSEELMRLIAGCLKKARWSIGQIDLFGVGVGPGSFTGLRIGLSTVKGLSFALQKPCVAFSSLEAIASGKFPNGDLRPAVMVDARRQNVYVRAGGRDRMKKFADALRLIKTSRALTGDALKTYAGELARRHPGAAQLPEKYWYPTPRALAALTVRAWKRGELTDSVKLRPVYFYAADCQVQRRAKT